MLRNLNINMNNFPAMPHRPTHHITQDHKDILDEMVNGMTTDEIKHVGNHLHNQADKLEDHAKGTVTMDDFHKAMKRGDVVKDTDKDEV